MRSLSKKSGVLVTLLLHSEECHYFIFPRSQLPFYLLQGSFGSSSSVIVKSTLIIAFSCNVGTIS